VSTERGVLLTHKQIDLKNATDAAFDAAGGQDRFAKATGRSQSSMSDAASLDTPTFLRLDVIGDLEDYGRGRPGHPHITRALARRQGFELVPSGSSGDEASLPMLLGQLGSEVGDVFRVLAARVGAAAPMSVRDHDDAMRELNELSDAVAALRHAHAANRPGGAQPPG
jgi:hypothetical protein